MHLKFPFYVPVVAGIVSVFLGKFLKLIITLPGAPPLLPGHPPVAIALY